MDLQLFCGCITLVGPDVASMAQKALGAAKAQQLDLDFPQTEMPLHITLLSKNEVRSLASRLSPERLLKQLLASLGTEPPRVFPLGLGGYPQSSPKTYYIIVIWAKGQQLRKQLGFPPKHFHITLSRQDTHGVDKGVGSLLTPFPDSIESDALDHLVFTLFVMGQSDDAKRYATRLCLEAPQSEKGFLRLGDISMKVSEHKLAMLAFARAFECCSMNGEEKAQEYCLRKLAVCSQHTEWGSVCTEWELHQLPDTLKPVLLQPFPSELRTKLLDLQLVPVLRRESREQQFIPSLRPDRPSYKLPRFFSWLIPFHIALMSTPRNALDITALASPHMQIRHVLTLTEETPLVEDWFSGTSGKIKNTFLPIPNYYPPTVEQMDLIVRLLRDPNNLPVLIHCGGGKGRAGTVAACYIATFGFSKIPSDPTTSPTQPAMSAPEAIAAIRALRPGSIETERQEAFVSKWCSTIWKRQSVFPDVVPEPPSCPMELEGVLDSSSNLVILVGLPGSGKSWVARALLTRDPDKWTWTCQDETGSRTACENAVGRFNGKGKLILDRCNTSQEDRKSWLSLGSHWAVKPVCVWFDYDRELCMFRAQNRAGHPTLPPGGRVRNAIDQMQKMLVRPKLEEGFAGVVTIRSLAAAEEFVRRISPPITLFKFPRTPHLLDLGGVTADDIVSASDSTLTSPSMSDSDGSTTKFVITEKVDGANMGFSLSSSRELLVQNRSHYVNPLSHAQFKKLGVWTEAHREDLYRILDRDPYFPSRYVLFGEWLAATHSISYSRLPDWFIAFDLYDQSTKTWVSRDILKKVVEGTRINIVPVIHEGAMVGADELREMVQRQSMYYEGRVEGVYVKAERDGKVVSRGKVVRGDFIAGNEHWTKNVLRNNEMIHGMYL